MELELSYAVVLIILVALAFDFLNGMNDAAKSNATVVATHVVPPRLAVAWAAFSNFAAGFIFGTAIAIPATARASARVLWLLQAWNLRFQLGGHHD